MLFVKHYRYILEYAFLKPPYSEFLHSDTLELGISLNFFQITLLLELLRPSLVKQVTEHQLDLHVELASFLCGVYLQAEVADVVELDLLLAVADHESTSVERVKRFV